ncbi:Prenyltransferase and squalene oxidase repeat protein [Planctomycetes bacterium Pan216]|uniref:Prenyltransferase and squalene oxidase repeat protein n=1 Tax=Kolteria novifilia TaxID=2527975 RepID=A0A518AXU0_9BACT|nr:Prenyltransferase and squalene oxidase repeat protein [Planctomycetes bacterium Pan216]
MADVPYLLRLTSRIAEGLTRLDDERRQRHLNLVRAYQQTDGGFAGRDGGSDIYYTAFGIRCLAMLDGLGPEDVSRLADHLRQVRDEADTLVDLLSWLSSAVVITVAGGEGLLDPTDPELSRLPERIAEFRTPDGGYNNSPGGRSGSTYHTFVATLCFDLLVEPIPNKDQLTQFVLGRCREDGGFVEVPAMKRSGTNPSAAAIGTLLLLDAITPAVRDGAQAFFDTVSSDEGGFAANTRIPIADGLSTFTGLVSLLDLELLDRDRARRIEKYARSLEVKQGGFIGFALDGQPDVEYTFYGLGNLGLVWSTIAAGEKGP